jgi:tRNA(fMet)-specific endonuclease VapC
LILDTNALSAWADGDPSIEFPLLRPDFLAVPAVVLGEFLFGVSRSRYRDRYHQWLTRELSRCRALSITMSTAEHYATVRQQLRDSGTPIPMNDIWIAAIALEHDLPVLTRDAHFDRVPGLNVVRW